MRKTNLSIAFLAALALSGVRVEAQPIDPDPEPKVDWGGFQTTGSTTLGYRLLSTSGRREKFLELFNLQSGPRLFDFDLLGTAKPGTSVFADSFQITGSGLGGDPYPGGQLTARKAKVYDLRVGFRQTYYYWDRNDNAALPTGLRGLTSNHNWATVRRFGNANLILHATNRLKFRIEYGRSSRDGVNLTTRTMEYFNSSSAYASYLRDNPFYVEAPILESLNRFAGGLDYTYNNWSFHYTVGYQTFNQSMNWNNVVSPERGINPDSATTAKELLSNATWSESRALRSPSSEFSYNGSLNDRISLRGGYMYFRYNGPSAVDAAFAGIVRTTGTNTAPYTVAQSSRAQISEPNNVVDQGVSIKLTDWWRFDGDYRFNQYNQEGTALVHSLRDGTTAFDGTAKEEWDRSIQQLDLAFEFLPIRGLIVRPGVRLMRRDTTFRSDDVIQTRETQLNRSVSPLASIAYVPSKTLSVRFDVQSTTTGVTYTRITPRTDVGTRLVVRYQPFRRLSIEENVVTRNRYNLGTNFENRIRSNGATVSWFWNDKLSTYAGFSYDSFIATANVTFLRGTAPLNTSWRDQTINRVAQLGITTKPLKRLGVNFNGNFVRTTGVGEISGEPPNFGPLTFPLATGTVYYDVPKMGRLAVDLQRTYYFEEIVRGNDFGANLLTIRWTKGF